MSDLSNDQKKLLRKFNSNWLARLYFLLNVPSLFFWGARIVHLDQSKCSIAVPFSWQTKNPFKSIYFGSQAGAAELSSGALALLATHGKNISMLVTGIKGTYHKKAKSKCIFTCDEGELIFKTVENTLKTAKPYTIDIESKGYDTKGDHISTFTTSWSFKKR